ncbi:hypothetical protein Pan54_04590 [Rubinisphaera italica]|uniref:Uncharacterized protein n=1 Tax=Rubinisphaera italica TaxID=2527969 RepID=A0A5C5XAR6_9PLAN|nr:hypothetical protein Pan54_04590 [Rubinisphaera italica]
MNEQEPPVLVVARNNVYKVSEWNEGLPTVAKAAE